MRAAREQELDAAMAVEGATTTNEGATTTNEGECTKESPPIQSIVSVPATSIPGASAATDVGGAMTEAATASTVRDGGAMTALSEQQPPSHEAIRAAVDQGAFEAAGIKARDDVVVSEGVTSLWPAKVTVAHREAAWMRPEVSRIMQGVGVSSLPRECGRDFEVRIERQRVLRRGGDGIAAELRARPRINDYIVDDASMFIINFATKENMRTLQEHGLGSVPCGNPACCGNAGRWHTHPVRWDSKTSAPSIVVREDGLSAPMIAACSHCETCKTVSSHINPITLRRLADVPELVDKLPFDPEWPFGDVYASRPHPHHACSMRIVSRFQSLLGGRGGGGVRMLHAHVHVLIPVHPAHMHVHPPRA